MSNQSQVSTRPEPLAQSAMRRELAAFAVGLVALTFVVVFFSDGDILFSRPLWSDEIQTLMVVSHGSPGAVLSDLSHGVDHGPGLMHLVVWAARTIVGSVPAPMLRWMGLLCLWGALVLVYAILRRRLSRDSSVAGALAAGTHSLVITHSFEARYYGPWLLLTALFAWCLSLSEARVSRRRRDVMIGGVSVLLVTVHWYGFITLGLMCCGAIASCGRRWRDGLRLVAPSVAGVLALMALVPLALGQRSVLSVNSWVADFTMRQLDQMAAMYWVAMVPGIAVVAFVAAALFSVRRDAAQSFAAVVGPTSKDASLVALAALALLPLALVALSLIGQPSAFPRYAIPAALAWAPLVGLAMELLGRWPARTFTAFLAVLWLLNFVRIAVSYRNFAIAIQRQTADLRRVESSGIPTVVQSMHTLYEVTAQNWPRRSEANYLELSDSTLAALFPRGTLLYQLNKTAIVERDLVRVHAKRFGYPRIVPQPALDTTSRFLILFNQSELPRGYTAEMLGRAVFPRHRLRQVSPDLWLFER
jgi:hypothetical protein